MRRRLPATLAITLLLAACRAATEPPPAPATITPTDVAPATTAEVIAPPPVEAPAKVAKRRPDAREGSTIALAHDGSAVYVADEDQGAVHIISLPVSPLHRPITVAVPGQPAQVLAMDGRVLVTIRSEGAAAPGKTGVSSPSGAGLLLVMRPDAERGLVEEARAELPEDAWGIAITPDGATALVTSAWAHKLSAVDLATAKVRWSINMNREPRGVVVRPDGQAAYVTHLVGAGLTRVDNLQGTPKARTVALPPSPLRTPPGQRLSASLTYAAVLSPDGRRLFVPRHALGALGSKAWFGSATVDVMVTRDDAPLAPFRSEAGGLLRKDPDAESLGGYFDNDLMGPGAAPAADPMAFAQPRAAAYVHGRDTILVAAEGSDDLVEMDARAVDPAMHVLRKIALAEQHDKLIPVATDCGAPSGIALSADEATAFVHCRSTSSVVAIPLAAAPGAARSQIQLASDPLLPLAARGRRLFYNATDSITSGGLGCAGCHPEGRDDGFVWHETTSAPPMFGSPSFVSSPVIIVDEKRHDGTARQTPMLAGRVDAEGPYGWHGESATLEDRLMGGFGLHRWSSGGGVRSEVEIRARALAAYLRQGLVPPPRRPHELSPREKRGKEIFFSDEAGCWACHTEDGGYTNRKAYDVFAQHGRPDGYEIDLAPFKTPSLRFVGGTAPYAHDGRFPTLAALIEDNNDQMGKTNHLSPDDRAALVAFLETL